MQTHTHDGHAPSSSIDTIMYIYIILIVMGLGHCTMVLHANEAGVWRSYPLADPYRATTASPYEIGEQPVWLGLPGIMLEGMV